MIECQFCHSQNRDNYVYTECDHLICLECSSAKWDHRYTLKCCGKTTFLQEQTCIILQKMNKAQNIINRVEEKENYDVSLVKNKVLSKGKVNQSEESARNEKIQQSIYISELEAKCMNKQERFDRSIDELKSQIRIERQRQSAQEAIRLQINQSEREQNHQNREDIQLQKEQDNLLRMEAVMGQSVAKIKFTFEMYRKQLQKRQEMLLKQVYNKYSDHLKCIKTTVTEQNIGDLRDQLNHTISDQISKLTLKQGECRQDKILQKLQYNQMKMKQKLNRHYQLLK